MSHWGGRRTPVTTGNSGAGVGNLKLNMYLNVTCFYFFERIKSYDAAIVWFTRQKVSHVFIDCWYLPVADCNFSGSLTLLERSQWRRRHLGYHKHDVVNPCRWAPGYYLEQR